MNYERDLVKVHLQTGRTTSDSTSATTTNAKQRSSIEWGIHAYIYNKLSNVNAVVHTHSPYTLAIAISVNEFEHIIYKI